MPSLIVNSPFETPTHHWVRQAGGDLQLVEGRRPANYEIFDTRYGTVRTVELALVNQIRERVDAWRDADFPGITGVTRKLLSHWHDSGSNRVNEFYFCQLEAIETLIWSVEASVEYKQGIAIPSDGGDWQRLCLKMATGSGKTTVMAMAIAWQVLNAITYPKRNKDFSSAVFIVAPGLTVRERLQVLLPGNDDNYYDVFDICPNDSLRQKLNQADIAIQNWHNLMPMKEQERSVVRKGKESDEAFTKRVLGKLASHKDILIINDEAHHAYRNPAGLKISKQQAEELGVNLDQATRWIEGLDRIHKTRRISKCFDLSATPFAPTGKTSTDTALFDWVISDFGLNDAIEAGLVKTPRVVIRDSALPNAQTFRSKLYHIYREPEVAEDLNRSGAQPFETLPQIVQEAYTLLGADWRETRKAWELSGHPSPPVMLTVCNRTETAARIEHYFRNGEAFWPELHAPTKTLRVDSRVMSKAESGETSSTDNDYEGILNSILESTNIPETLKIKYRSLKKEELLRVIVDNVGKKQTPGQDLQNVISVAMLSEGWDAKNVTHIMGLRAFSSQLLCEQVIGRGLRRVSYDTELVLAPDGKEKHLFVPEYVNVFGVPLTIFQDSEDEGTAPPLPKPSTQIESLDDRRSLELTWPNILRIDSVLQSELTLDWAKIPKLKIDPAKIRINAELAPALGSAADMSKAVSIDLEKIPEAFRLQRLLFLASRKAYLNMESGLQGSKEVMIQQIVKLVEKFYSSDRIDIPSEYHSDPLRKRILLALSIDSIVNHVVEHITEQNFERLEPVFDLETPLGSTDYMNTWYTTKPCIQTTKSQISHAVADSTWEQYSADVLEKSSLVESYAKNDHLNFHVYYLWNGTRRRYVPDYIVRLSNGVNLVLEVKGQDSEQNLAKRSAMNLWVEAVNSKSIFGVWASDTVLGEPSRIQDVLKLHNS
jgi:type III restriction enzyme